MPELTLPLYNPVAAEPSVTGSKGATLARLHSLGFPVPNAWVVTTETYRRLVDDPEIQSLLADIERSRDGDVDDQATSAAELREAIQSLSLPPSVSETLRSLPEGQYAVRSSGTTEDLPEASFAGQYDTHLGVEQTDELVEAVLGCFASLFSDRAIAYRDRNDISTESMAMAVIVQRMVEPDTSGILFTADPISGNRTISVIDAGPGRGDLQVSGRATADTVRVDSVHDEILEYTISADRVAHALSDDDVRALAAIGERIEETLGGPQDIEWAITDGEIFVLQSRPTTALFPVPEPQPTNNRTHLYYSFGHRQNMPEAMPPLSLDLWYRLTDLLRESLGFEQRFAATAGGRLYIDLTAYLQQPRLRQRLMQNFTIIDEPAGNELQTFLAERPADFPLSTPSIRGYVRAGRSLVRITPFLLTMLRGLPRALFVSDPEMTPVSVQKAYDSRCERAIKNVQDEETISARIETALRELGEAFNWLLDPFYAPFLAAMLAKFLLGRLVPGEREHVDALALGIEDDVVYGMTMAIGDLADVARETPAVAATIRNGATRADLEAREDATVFLDALDRFLDEYGFRAIGEIDPSRPRYREKPALLLNVVAGTLEATEPGEHRRHSDALESRALRAEQTLVRNSPILARPLVRRLASVYRGNIGIREHPKFAISRLLDVFRDAVLDAAAALESDGVLSDPKDVWLLSYDELLAGLDDPRSLTGLNLPERRREFDSFQDLSAPRLITSDGEIPHAPPERNVKNTLTGTGAAPGVVEGVAHVITDPTRERLERGEILVAPYTDPGWTPLFLNAAAVVTEVGGQLTHGSLVAREYAIPAAVAVEDATTEIQTGDHIRVDGTNGVITWLG